VITFTLVLLVLAGSWACLDRTQAGQFMIARPIVIGPLYGLWAEAPGLGLAIGLAFEFLYAGRLPVGSHVPPSDTLAALGAAGVLVLEPEFRNLGDAGVATALALPMAEWGRRTDVWVRRVNGQLAERVDERLEQGNLAAIERIPWLALLFAGGVYAGTLLVFYLGAPAIMHVLSLPGWLKAGFGFFLAGLPLIGLAESAATLDLRRFPKAAIAGLTLGIVLLLVVT
jgi:mannose/fructose/N-acetylgalactosamine-specific phosphotransferase system component IIC